MPRLAAGIKFVLLACVSTLLAGCSIFSLGSHLSSSLLEQRDPVLVREGAPAYLLMLDAMISADPDDVGLRTAAAKLYSLYGTALVADAPRSRLLTAQGRYYGESALCLENKKYCGLTHLPTETLEQCLPKIKLAEVPVFYAAAVSWLASIQANSDDWAALADLPKVESLLARLVVLDEQYEHGSLHAYLGILKTLRPAALGGDPEAGQRHFLRAVELSEGRDLGFKVAYAAGYARAVYDRPLHDQLLQDVLAADPVAPGLTLLNVLAQQQARQLMDSADDFF